MLYYNIFSCDIQQKIEISLPSDEKIKNFFKNEKLLLTKSKNML